MKKFENLTNYYSKKCLQKVSYIIEEKDHLPGEYVQTNDTYDACMYFIV